MYLLPIIPMATERIRYAMTMIQSREVKVTVDLRGSGGSMQAFSQSRCGGQNATTAPNSVRRCLPAALPREHHRPWLRLNTGEGLVSKGKQARPLLAKSPAHRLGPPGKSRKPAPR